MTRSVREQLGLLLLAAALLAYTFTDPTAELPQPIYRYVYVFDISQSMNVTDVAGASEDVTRLEHAKQAAIQSLSALPCGSEIGVALFSGHRNFLLITPIEVCANFLELSSVIDRVDWRMTWKRRSEIAKGLFKSLLLLKDWEGETRLAFFTDGHEAPPIHPDLQPNFTGKPGRISGLIVGVGGTTPVQIPKFNESGRAEGYWEADEVEHVDSFTQSQAAREGDGAKIMGTEHLSSLREEYLLSLAKKTGLTYHHLTDIESFFEALKGPGLDIAVFKTTDLHWLFAIAAAIAMIATLLYRRSSSPA